MTDGAEEFPEDILFRYFERFIARGISSCHDDIASSALLFLVGVSVTV
jgi:hypothetical protein